MEGRTGVRAVGHVGECLVVPKRRDQAGGDRTLTGLQFDGDPHK